MGGGGGVMRVFTWTLTDRLGTDFTRCSAEEEEGGGPPLSYAVSCSGFISSDPSSFSPAVSFSLWL